MDILSVKKWFVVGCAVLLSVNCSKDDSYSGGSSVTPGVPATPVDGLRLAWDHSSLAEIAPSGDHPRVCELGDGTLLAVYVVDGNCWVRLSRDGKKWGYASRVFMGGISDPSVLCLADGRACMVALHTDDAGVASILFTESSDKGFTWSASRTVYTASDTVGKCAGPTLLELSDGTLQCYFASAAGHLPYMGICVVNSSDGKVWSAPRACSYTPGKSETAVAAALCNGRIVLTFQSLGEDGVPHLQTLSAAIDGNWEDAERKTVIFSSDDAALGGKTPYLVTFGTGTVMSYGASIAEGTQNRIMRVALGDGDAGDWTNPTEPFLISASQTVTDGSLLALSDGSLLAVGKTALFSSTPRPCVIRGYVIPELTVPQGNIYLDGVVTEEEWGKVMPIFVGHRGSTRVRAALRRDGNVLYVGAEVWDNKQISGLPGVKDNYTANGKGIDGITLYIDPFAACYDAPGAETFMLVTVPDGGYALMNYRNGMWDRHYDTAGIEVRTQQLDDRYFVEMAVPLSKLGKNDLTPLRLTFGLNASDETEKYEEMISLSSNAQPNTWCRVVFE